MTIPVLIVLRLNVESPEKIVKVLEHMDPPTIPGFVDELRIVVGEENVDEVIEFLDEDE